MDRYVIDAFIAEGGTADVYRVKHGWLHSTHCLKHARLEGPELRNAVLEEGRIQAMQEHPNLVRVTDCFELDGRPALIMDFIDGPTLGDWLVDHQPTPLDDVIRLIRGIARGLYAAHAVGLVHRDLKPENVLLSARRDGMVVPRICDFGFAKNMVRGDDGNTLSGVFRLVGTPEYMAPEQIRSPGDVTVLSDMFSVGVVLYELITGVVPFDADTPEEVVELVLRGDYVRVDIARRDTPRPLARCVDALLQADPSKRPRHCGVLLQMLDALSSLHG